MNDDVKAAIQEGADQIRNDCDGYSDAIQYVDDLANDINSDLKLGYERDSDSYGVLYKECYSAIRRAHGMTS